MILTLTKKSKYIMSETGRLIKAQICNEVSDKVYITVNGIEMPYYWVHKEIRMFEIPLLLNEGDVLGISGDVTMGVEIEL